MRWALGCLVLLFIVATAPSGQSLTCLPPDANTADELYFILIDLETGERIHNDRLVRSYCGNSFEDASIASGPDGFVHRGTYYNYDGQAQQPGGFATGNGGWGARSQPHILTNTSMQIMDTFGGGTRVQYLQSAAYDDIAWNNAYNSSHYSLSETDDYWAYHGDVIIIPNGALGLDLDYLGDGLLYVFDFVDGYTWELDADLIPGVHPTSGITAAAGGEYIVIEQHLIHLGDRDPTGNSVVIEPPVFLGRPFSGSLATFELYQLEGSQVIEYDILTGETTTFELDIDLGYDSYSVAAGHFLISGTRTVPIDVPTDVLALLGRISGGAVLIFMVFVAIRISRISDPIGDRDEE